MPVLEIATLPCRPEANKPEFLFTLRKGFDIQTAWLAQAHPDKPLLNHPVSVCYRSVNEPLEFVIMARWASVDAHMEWIQSEENKGVMESLLPYLVDKDAVSVVHIETFPEARPVLLPCGHFVVIERSFPVGTTEPLVKGLVGGVIRTMVATENIGPVTESDGTFTHGAIGGTRVDIAAGKETGFAISCWDEVDGWEKALGHFENLGLPETSAKVYKRFL